MRVFAAMDIGTNSIRLAVVEVKPGYTWSTLASQRQVVRLGDGEFRPEHKKRKKAATAVSRHRLTDDAISRGALVCARFAEVARGYGAEEIVALATAAVREAENQDEFVERVREVADLDVRVISGHEEARLIYLGVSTGVELTVGKRGLFIDIGGGSTELILGDSAAHVYLDSLKMGAIRLTSEHVTDPTKPISTAEWSALQNQVRSALAPAVRQITARGFAAMYGSSGTIMNLADMISHARGGPNPTSLRNFTLTLPDLQALTGRLCAMGIEQRRKVPGINPERADIIIGGAAILQTTMEEVGAASLYVSDRGLREGIVIDRLMRVGTDEEYQASFALGARLRSIQNLMLATGVDEVHARHIQRLSCELFDQWKELGLHGYGRARELLEYAALLHDCGFFVSHTDHQLHSYYLIRHSELLGFNDGEIEIMANLALYHRKGLPKSKNADFDRLGAKTKRVIRVLSCALRLAEAMDRGHLMLVSDVSCERRSKPDRIVMTLHCTDEAELEWWAVQGQMSAFEKTFGIPLEIERKLQRTNGVK